MRRLRDGCDNRAPSTLWKAQNACSRKYMLTLNKIMDCMYGQIITQCVGFITARLV